LLRVEYHEKLEETRTELIILGALVVDAQHQALKALTSGDTALAGRIIADEKMDLMRRAIEQSAIELLWRQQPIASELREVTTIHEIAVDLGIIIGYVMDVAKQAIRATNASSCPDTTDVRRVAEAAETMLTEAMRAFKERDADRAHHVYTTAEQAENEFTPVVETIERYMQDHPDSVACCVPLLFVLTAEQRICDRAENIAWHTEEML
jgi:phosphate transport system protein